MGWWVRENVAGLIQGYLDYVWRLGFKDGVDGMGSMVDWWAVPTLREIEQVFCILNFEFPKPFKSLPSLEDCNQVKLINLSADQVAGDEGGNQDDQK